MKNLIPNQYKTDLFTNKGFCFVLETKWISRIHVLKTCINSRFVSLFSYQSSLLLPSAATRLYYHDLGCLSTTFYFNFFRNSCLIQKNQLVNSIICVDFCQALFTIFYRCFSEAFRSRDSLFIISSATRCVNKFFIFFKHFSQYVHQSLYRLI